MNAINKYWEQETEEPYQQNLFGQVDLRSETLETALLASYWRTSGGWEWHIYIYNNLPDMQEHGTCATEEETRQKINYYINLV